QCRVYGPERTSRRVRADRAAGDSAARRRGRLRRFDPAGNPRAHRAEHRTRRAVYDARPPRAEGAGRVAVRGADACSGWPRQALLRRDLGGARCPEACPKLLSEPDAGVEVVWEESCVSYYFPKKY